MFVGVGLKEDKHEKRERERHHTDGDYSASNEKLMLKFREY